ncbi:MAG: acyl carrier protein [Desulfovibrio sp.]|nr:acyl carrier protein [Desulfovibrio sp.]
MTVQECRDDLRQALVESLNLEGVEPESIADDTPLFGPDGLNLDSLDAVELVVVLEKRYGVRMANAQEARRHFTSISTLADFILASRQA